jgi:hypothetical protein
MISQKEQLNQTVALTWLIERSTGKSRKKKKKSKRTKDKFKIK